MKRKILKLISEFDELIGDIIFKVENYDSQPVEKEDISDIADRLISMKNEFSLLLKVVRKNYE